MYQMKRNIVWLILHHAVLRTILAGSAVAMLTNTAIFAQVSAASQARTTTSEGNAENGKKLFAAYNCWACHGSLGRAGGAAPAIAPSTRTADQLIRYIRKPAGTMPARSVAAAASGFVRSAATV